MTGSACEVLVDRFCINRQGKSPDDLRKNGGCDGGRGVEVYSDLSIEHGTLDAHGTAVMNH